MRIIAATTEREFADALALRFEVFVYEQQVSAERERDNLDDDPRTLHCVAYADDGTVVGAGRLLAPHTDTAHGAGTGHGAMNPEHPHIGRLAVAAKARRTRIGTAVMEFLEAAALERHGAQGSVRVELSSQEHALPFYEKIGYAAFGERYLDEGIWHFDSFKVIQS